VKDELADLSHEWWFSATGKRYVTLDTYLFCTLEASAQDEGASL